MAKISAESQKQIKDAKHKQQDIVIERDKVIADIKSNITELQQRLTAETEKRQVAVKILESLDKDFPDITEAVEEV